MSIEMPTYNEILSSALKSKNLPDIIKALDNPQKISLENVIRAFEVSNDLGGQFFEGRSTFEITRLVFNSPFIEETVNSDGRDIVKSVVELGDTESLMYLVEKFPTLEKIVKTKIGPFELAAQFCHKDGEMVKYLWTFPEVRDMVTPDELEDILEGTAEYAPDKIEVIRGICEKSPAPRPF